MLERNRSTASALRQRVFMRCHRARHCGAGCRAWDRYRRAGRRRSEERAHQRRAAGAHSGFRRPPPFRLWRDNGIAGPVAARLRRRRSTPSPCSRTRTEQGGGEPDNGRQSGAGRGRVRPATTRQGYDWGAADEAHDWGFPLSANPKDGLLRQRICSTFFRSAPPSSANYSRTSCSTWPKPEGGARPISWRESPHPRGSPAATFHRTTCPPAAAATISTLSIEGAAGSAATAAMSRKLV